MSTWILVLIIGGYVLVAILGFTAGYLLGKRRRPPQRVQTRLR